MNTSLLSTLLAQDGGGGSPLSMFFPFILIIVMMYFLMIRPQKKRQKEMQNMIAAMKTGDEVVSAGGIHGVIANMSDRTVTVKVADNVKIKFDKTSIATVIPKGSRKAEDSSDDTREADSDTADEVSSKS